MVADGVSLFFRTRPAGAGPGPGFNPGIARSAERKLQLPNQPEGEGVRINPRVTRPGASRRRPSQTLPEERQTSYATRTPAVPGGEQLA